MQISIRNAFYEFHPHVLSSPPAREGYFRLANRIFGLDFEKWYDSGYWDGRFIPYVLYDKGLAVSSAAVCVNDVQWNHTVKRYAQISTVMTLPEYRHRGLSRWLMEHILREWKNMSDAIYLLGNDSVAGFYPKFGFREYTEYDFTMPLRKGPGTYRKLNVSAKEDFGLLIRKYKGSNPFAAVKVDNLGQFVFHCLQFLSDHIYYMEAYDAVVLAKHEGDTLVCYDVFADGECDLETILGVLADENTRYAYLGFTPVVAAGCRVVPSQEEDNHLFVMPDGDNLFEREKVMFPLLSRA